MNHACHRSRPGPLSRRERPHVLAARAIYCAVFLCGFHPAGWAQDSAGPGRTMEDILSLGLEELMNIEVTSVSKQPERLLDAVASIFVITGEDIRRSGASTLPEALRLAPNLQVARNSVSGYAISARGFNNDNGLANKLLVLIDGRTVYSLSLSGVFWDMQDVLLEDIERIEVISGPGATLWGANAVNGVINVITRSAENTQGILVALEGGNQEMGAAFRYGRALGSGGHLRVYGKTTELQNAWRADGSPAPDGWRRQQIGFRGDWNRTNRQVTIQGDAYGGQSQDQPALTAVEVSGANLLARWHQRLDNGSSLRVQAYYDQSERDDRLLFRDQITVSDLEFQHAIPLQAHQLLWGGGYRYARSETQNSLFFGFVPPNRNLEWANVFVQDAITLSRNLEFTAGLKFESNDYTDWEYLPSARLAWKLSGNQMVWGAVSRAVRAPARLDRELFFPPNGLFIRGGPDFVSEVANVFELGYRAQPTAALNYSMTAFHHDYDKLRSGQPPPAVVQNEIEGTTQGVEAWASYDATRTWRLSGGVTVLRKDLRVKPGSPDPVGPSALGNDPEQQWLLRSAYNFSDRHEFDLMLRHIGSLPQPAVPAYTVVDARWAWRPDHAYELSVNVRNLFDRDHAEFGRAPVRSEFGREVLLKVLYRL